LQVQVLPGPPLSPNSTEKRVLLEAKAGESAIFGPFFGPVRDWFGAESGATADLSGYLADVLCGRKNLQAVRVKATVNDA